MPFNFHVGLPGPFSYSKRIGSQKPGPPRAPGLVVFVIVLAVVLSPINPVLAFVVTVPAAIVYQVVYTIRRNRKE